MKRYLLLLFNESWFVVWLQADPHWGVPLTFVSVAVHQVLCPDIPDGGLESLLAIPLVAKVSVMVVVALTPYLIMMT